MLKTASRPLSPQYASETSSVRSATTDGTWVSLLTSHPPSTGLDERRGWTGKRQKSSTMPYFEEPSDSRMSSRRPSISASMRSAPNDSSTHVPLSAYSTYKPGRSIVSPPPAAYHDSTPKSPARSQNKVKIKPLLKKSSDKGKIDLSKSMAENEGLGIFVNSSSTSAATGARRATNHTRSSSGVSQMSTATASSNPRGGGYVHPMRQNAAVYTPPLSRSRAGSHSDDEDEDDDHHHHHHPPHGPDGHFVRPSTKSPLPPPPPQEHFIAHSYAPRPSVKRTPPPLHIRTHSSTSSRLRQTPSQTNLPPTPSSLRYANPPAPAGAEPFPPLPSHALTTAAASASPPSPAPDPYLPDTTPATPATTVPGAASVRTARSSLDSAFRSNTKRSRTNTQRSDDPHLAVRQARAEFAAREAAKEERWRAKEARRERRREKERTRARVGGGSVGPSDVSLAGRSGRVVDEEIEWMRRGKRVPKERRVEREKGEGRPGRWSLFWFGVKSVFLRIKRGLGGS